MSCPHRELRCIHGDAINFADGNRAECVECFTSLPGPLPVFCDETGRLHKEVQKALDNDRWP